MNKDIFEQVLRDHLQSAQADVPANAWASIQSQIGSGAMSSTSASASGGFGMTFGLVAGAGLLLSVATYSSYRTSEMNDKKINLNSVHISNNNVESVSNNRQAETIQFEEARNSHSNEENQNELALVKPTADIVIVEKAKSSEIVHEARNSTNSSMDKIEPITSTNVVDEKTSKNKAASSAKQNQPSSDLANANPTKSAAKTNNESSHVGQDGVLEEEVEAIDAIIGASEISGYTPMKVKFDNLGEGLHYEWNFGIYGTRYEKSPEITFDEPGTYSVYLTVSNDVGDVVTDVIQVKVKEGSHLYIPTAITPNGDGRNDNFKADAYLIDSFLMIITNENGDIVFETRDVNQAWNFDQTNFNSAGERYYVTYKGIGIDGKEHAKHRMPLTIVLQ